MEESILRIDPMSLNYYGNADLEDMFLDHTGLLRIPISYGKKTKCYMDVIFHKALSSRVADEGYLWLLIDMGCRLGLQIVQNSKYVEWYCTRTGRKDVSNITHYVFATDNDIVEVLSETEPEIIHHKHQEG